METLYKQTTVADKTLPAVFPGRFDSTEPRFDLHYQIVLRVADESNPIEEKWRLHFYKYLSNCVKICGGSVEVMSGSPDRVHLLIALRATKALADFLRELKLLSKTWVRRKKQISQFAWQNEIEAYTVSSTQREQVKSYIRRQGAYFKLRGA
jgi:REP element-mobilizing transposase RayT